MAMTIVEVTTYKVFIYGGPEGNNGADASISLEIADERASLTFYPEGVTLPANRKTTYTGSIPTYHVSYRYAQLSNVVDLLRNEKPIRFIFNDESLAAYITTSREPVGEEEIQQK